MLIPMAVFSGGLAPVVGKLVDRINPRYIALFGLLLFAVSLYWYSIWLDPNPDLAWRLLIPSGVLGIAMSCVWSPISTTATYNLPQAQAGAGAGVYNTTRQIGAVLGSASIAVLIEARLGANGIHSSASGAEFGGTLPAPLQAGFTDAMAQSMLLPAAVALVGAVIVIFFEKHKKNDVWDHALTEQGARNAAAAEAAATAGGEPSGTSDPDATHGEPVTAGVRVAPSPPAAHGSHAAPVPPDGSAQSSGAPDGQGAHGVRGTHGSHAAPVDPE
jgi:MFS family permease